MRTSAEILGSAVAGSINSVSRVMACLEVRSKARVRNANPG
ncbi:Uncharacterised protein [Mycobacteroides abscessus subsp. abscessus]|nr:Uncharacterised protein [Mycobacteroides abscessus subsp. abscessus]